MNRAQRQFLMQLTDNACPALNHIWTDASPTFVIYLYMSLFPDKEHVVHASPTESGVHIAHAEFAVRGLFRRRVCVPSGSDRIVPPSQGPELHEFLQDILNLVPHDPERPTEFYLSYPPEGRLVISVSGSVTEYDFNRLHHDDPLRQPTYCLNEAIQRHLGFTAPELLGHAESVRVFCRRFGFDRIPAEGGIQSLADQVDATKWAAFYIDNWKRMPKQVSARILDTMLLSLSQRPDTTELADLREVLRLAQTDPETCRILDKYIGKTRLETGYRAVLDLIFDSVDIEAVQSTLASARNKGT